MKKTLLKALSSTLALTLIATASVATASVKNIPAQEIKARPAAAVEEVREDVRENTILAAVEAKIKEEKAAEVKEIAAPVAEIAKAEPVKKAAPVKAAEEVAVPVAAPAVEVREAAPEVPEVPAEAEPVAEWNISATEFDNVAMAFYAEPAAESDAVEIDEATGIAYIKGVGEMEPCIYRYFLSTEKYLAATKAIYEKYYGVEVEQRVREEAMIDIVELDATTEYYSVETGERLNVTPEMLEEVTHYDFAKYHPTTIIIEEGITNISECAFVLCNSIETIVIPSTVEKIGFGAFEHCNGLKSIVIPEDAKLEYCVFACCSNLTTVQLANADYYLNGGIATSADGENENVRTLSAEEVNALVNNY